jgi:hypothetical protein
MSTTDSKYGNGPGQIERRKNRRVTMEKFLEETRRPEISGKVSIQATGQKGGAGTVHFKGIGKTK